MEKLRVTVWNEFYDEKQWPEILDIYPGGVHQAIKRFLDRENDLEVTVSTQQDTEQGLSQELLDRTDVLIWYSHMEKEPIAEERIDAVIRRVLDGMGLIFLHSSLGSQLASQLLGARGHGTYREIGEKERVWVIDRSHPIAQGLNEYFEFPQSEMYGEPCDIPTPDELIFISWYAGGNAARSGYTYRRGAGKIFYFSPGHAWYDVMNREEFQTVVKNAVRRARPPQCPPVQSRGRIDSLEKISELEE